MTHRRHAPRGQASDPNPSPGSAFTLVELLVVVVILAILASLLLPALGRAKGAARTTECRHNLRTLGLAIQMYIGDFAAYPATAGFGGSAEGHGWAIKPTPESRVVSPASLIAAGDILPGSTMGEMFWTAGAFDPCSTQRARWPGENHAGNANMLFCDGHVESARQANWIAPTDTARRRWNNDHEPHPETWGRE